MTRHVVTIHGKSDRERAARWAMNARDGMRIEFKEAKRSLPQNDKFWACLTDVAAQVTWHGLKLPADDWKFIFLDALKRELRMVPNIDGTGFVNLGRSSSDLSKDEMSNLIELVHAFGAQHGVTFHDSEDSNSSEQPQQASPSAALADAPAVESRPPPEAAGNLSESSRAEHAGDGEAQAGDAPHAGTGLPSTLPAGWQVAYAGALREAADKKALTPAARRYWAKYSGWSAHKDGPDGPTATAIYDAFNSNFGNRDAIDEALREII